jgi:nucleoside-triphosphatase THEP1
MTTTPRIHILTGPVRTGKTTRLMAWSRERDDVDGFLSPDVDGLRTIYHIRTRAYFPFEASPGTPEHEGVAIGRFVFHRGAFERARGILAGALESPPGWLVVDEVGKLEMRGEGLEPGLGVVIERYRGPGERGLVLVVRDSLLEMAVARYRIDGCCRVVRDPADLCP